MMTPQLTEVVGVEANALRAHYGVGIWACPPDLSDADRAEVAELRLLYDQGLLFVRDIPEYQLWQGMKGRCHNPNDKAWSAYGGRGLEVCEAWRRDFWAFMGDMGRRPTLPGFFISIDRFNVDGNYEPGNCRWASQRAEQ